MSSLYRPRLHMAADVSPHTSAVAQDAQYLDTATNSPSNAALHSLESENLPSAVLSHPPFINSIAELRNLSEAITAFQKNYADIRNTLDSIQNSIMSFLPQETTETVPPAAPSSSKPLALEEKVSLKQSEQNSELEACCRKMCSRGVRKYLTMHLSDLPKLREEVPKALKLAPNPPKLVLECLGKFFLQGSKAFTRNSHMIPAREASILILVCFLLMMGMDGYGGAIDMERSLQEEAETAALAWRKRLIAEGGLAQASEIDARGLLLFVACFGIPASFKMEDIRDVVVAANAKEIACVLKKSHVLMSKLPEIVEELVKNKMEVDAVDIAYTFGLTEKFSPRTILTTFLRVSCKKPKMGSQASIAANNEANEKHLADLKSVAKCLEKHKVDPAKILPEWQINEIILSLEKEIPECSQKPTERAANKRKATEPESSKKPKNQEAKRFRYPAPGPRQQKPMDRIGNRRNFPDNRFPSHRNTYSGSPSVAYEGPGAGFPPRFGNSLSGNHGIQGGVQVDTTVPIINHRSQPYTWHRDTAINERYVTGQPSSVGLTSLYMASPTVEGFVGATNVPPVRGSTSTSADLYHFADLVGEGAGSIPRGGSAVVPTTTVPPYLYHR